MTHLQQIRSFVRGRANQVQHVRQGKITEVPLQIFLVAKATGTFAVQRFRVPGEQGEIEKRERNRAREIEQEKSSKRKRAREMEQDKSRREIEKANRENSREQSSKKRKRHRGASVHSTHQCIRRCRGVTFLHLQGHGPPTKTIAAGGVGLGPHVKMLHAVAQQLAHPPKIPGICQTTRRLREKHREKARESERKQRKARC